MNDLPIDPFLPRITQSLARCPSLVLVAEPGAGKTTRVPGAILDAGLAGKGSVIVLEPRRIAARAAAAFVARERGGGLGDEVGYRVRFDERGGRATRIWYVTEGILTRMLARDPYLEEAGAIVLDEFHERHLAGDVALAVARELQETVRPDLRLVVMSATLDPAPLAAYLRDAQGNACPVLDVPGRAHPVEKTFLPRADDRPLPQLVASGVVRALEATAGDLLVFLPGAGEIRRCAEALAETSARRDLLLVTLHGDLPLEEQDRALRPAARRKVILATNVAESSLTIDGVDAVVDAGLARVARHDPRRGLDVLRVERISRASAEQRAGRAGRQRRGWCLRLWTREEHNQLADAETPEIRRVDLTGSVLELLGWGRKDLDGFGWFERPEAAAVQRALALLWALDAIDPKTNDVTPVGRAMLRLPAPPRVARMLVEAVRRGDAEDGAVLAALVGEKDICLEARTFGARGRGGVGHGAGASPWREGGPSDLLLRAELFAAAGGERFTAGACRELGLDPAAVAAVARAARSYRMAASRLGDVGGPATARGPAGADAAGHVTLCGFPDRVARRRAPESREAVMVGGRGVRIAETSVVHEGELFVVVDLDARAGDAWSLARQVSRIERAWLDELFPGSIRTERSLVFDAAAGRVVERRATLYLDLPLEETSGSEVDRAAAGELLAQVARKDPRKVLRLDDACEALVARANWLAERAPDLGVPVVDDALLADVAADLCAGKRALRELAEAPVLEALQARLGWDKVRLLDREAPDRVQLPSQRHARIRYEKGKEPAVAARLQEFFGLAAVPRIAGGRVAIVLELLAPNHRPVQITTDLPSFWRNVYPKIRSELRRRYPRHAWPDDPLSAAPQARPARRPPR